MGDVNGKFVIQGSDKSSSWAIINKVEKGGGFIQDGKFRDSLRLLGFQKILYASCGVSR